MNKSIKDSFNASKLYNKYLQTLKTKLNNSNIDATTNFKELSESSDQLYEEIQNEWFYLSNNDMIKSFRLKNDNIELHKTNFYENYYALESIAKLYGFDAWYTTARFKLTSSSSPSIISSNINKNIVNNNI